jgi:pimeloyl-ACP methyl ester carboxylesterase
MTTFIPWNSQPLESWAEKHAPGKLIKLDGQSTHYVEKGEGQPVILLHGFFYDTYMWQKNIDFLAERFKVYAMDLWGFGYSTREPLDYGYPLYARQLRLFMDAMQIPRASLVGQSMGGGTIIKFAVGNQERVNKIILVDPAAMPNRLPIMGRISNLPGIGELMYGLNSNFIRKMALKNTFLHKAENISDDYFETVTRFHKIKGTHKVMLTITRKQFFDTLSPEVQALGDRNLPVLIVWGRQDVSIPLERGSAMHEILKGSRLEILDEAGHCAHDDRPDLFNPLAAEFLS